MAYNLYDLGIPGKEIKRRLNMLGGIENDVNDAIAVAITKLDDKIQIDIINALNGDILEKNKIMMFITLEEAKTIALKQLNKIY